MRFIVLMFVLGLALAPSRIPAADPQPAASPADAAAFEKRVAELERQLAALQKELQELRRQLNTQGKTDSEKPENAVAWGKAVNNLQAGLRSSASKPKVALGDVVSFEIVVRNIGEESVKVPYVEPSAFLGAVNEDKQLLLTPVGVGHGFESTRDLAPGKEMVFGVSLLLLPPRQTVSPGRPWVEITPAKYRISSPSVLMRRGASDNKLATGALELEVLQPQEKKP